MQNNRERLNKIKRERLKKKERTRKIYCFGMRSEGHSQGHSEGQQEVTMDVLSAVNYQNADNRTCGNGSFAAGTPELEVVTVSTGSLCSHEAEFFCDKAALCFISFY